MAEATRMGTVCGAVEEAEGGGDTMEKNNWHYRHPSLESHIGSGIIGRLITMVLIPT